MRVGPGQGWLVRLIAAAVGGGHWVGAVVPISCLAGVVIHRGAGGKL
jgi:hypothetical protein